MKSKKCLFALIALSAISIVALIVFYAYKISYGFDVNITVDNNTGADYKVGLNILIGNENSSASNTVYYLDTIEKNREISNCVNVKQQQGDFAILADISGSELSSYFSSGTKLSYVNIQITVYKNTDGTINTKGVMTSKNIFGLTNSPPIKIVC